MDIVFGQLRSLYAYSGLVMDSLDTDAELPPGFDFSVHEMALGSHVDDVEAELRAETSAGMLALKIAIMFGKFQDAHTQFQVNPLARTLFAPPIKIDIKLDEATEEMRLLVTKREFWAPAGLEGKFLVSINGGAPLDYFLEVAARTAYDKSPGARLNRYLRFQKLQSVPPQDFGVFNATFDDGQTHRLEWRALMPEDQCGLGADYRLCGREEQLLGMCANTTEIMTTCFTHNPAFDNMVDLFDTLGRDVRCTAGGTLARAAVGGAARKAKRGAAPLSPAPAQGPSPGERVVLPTLAEKFLVQELETSDKEESNATAGEASGLIEVVKAIADNCYTFKVDLGGSAFASVLKVVKFKEYVDLIQCLEAAVDLAADVSGGKLIIDVIGNGGGSVLTGYLMNTYLYSRMPGSTMRHPHQACEWYDLALNDELGWFVELSTQGLPDLAAQNDTRGFISSLANRMDMGVEALGRDPGYFGRSRKASLLNESAACLRVLLSRFEDPEVPRKGTPEWTVFASLYSQCVKLSQPLGGNSGMNIMDYFPGNNYPDDISPPSWQYYMDPVTKIRGGQPRKFSRMSFLGLACPGYMAAYPESYGTTNLTGGNWSHPPQSKLAHVTYLSDGTCGSTCSVSTTSPFLDGMSTVVTYGGVKGEAMDMTSFNGGNVGLYQSSEQSDDDLSKASLDSVVDASVFHPAAEPPNWPFLPVPLNLYSLNFAQRATYPRALGPKALPREWYLIPASYHLDVWVPHTFEVFEALQEPALRALHGLYVETAGKAPKPFAPGEAE